MSVVVETLIAVGLFVLVIGREIYKLWRED